MMESVASNVFTRELVIHYAHTLAGEPKENWEPLEHHLAEVAHLCGEFSSAFGAADWGVALGGWHDLGKYSVAFQDYLTRTCDPDAGEEKNLRGRVDHSTFGAQHAARVARSHASVD